MSILLPKSRSMVVRTSPTETRVVMSATIPLTLGEEALERWVAWWFWLPLMGGEGLVVR